MKLKGGVIIIGSLIWEDHLKDKDEDKIRINWRNKYLLEKRISTKVPIRYGRESQSRKDTYTMIFSKYNETNLGKGIILPFNENVISFEIIEKQSIALAISEGIYKKNNKRLTSSWGTVGILINPSLETKDFASYELIKKKWSDIYNSYRDTLNPENYKLPEENESVITQEGFLNINWQPEMNDFDILLATPVVPKPKRKLTPKEIAERIKENDYFKYFFKNRENKIETAVDEEIQDEINN